MSQSELSAALESIIGATDGRGQITLASVLLDALPESLTLTATNLETSCRVALPAIVSAPGLALLPGRKLYEIVRALPGAPISLDLNGSKGMLTAGLSRYQLASIPPDQFPDVPTPDPSSDVQVDAALLRSILRRMLYAIGELGSKFVLHGLFIEVSGGNLTAVATDGHRLVIERWSISDSVPSWSGIVPKKAMAQLARQLEGRSPYLSGSPPAGCSTLTWASGA